MNRTTFYMWQPLTEENVQVIDLLNPGAKRSNLTVRWNKRSRAFVVDNLFSIECGELDDLVAVLEVSLQLDTNQGI